jgi:hypothetical protein
LPEQIRRHHLSDVEKKMNLSLEEEVMERAGVELSF